MLSLNQTYEDTRAIKVLVVPIGENSLFESHFNVVSRLRELPMYELTKPSSWKSQSQSFKHFDWSTGNLLFEYLRYDRVPNGPGDLDDFQCSRRVLIVMGLVNYPELGDANIEEELGYFARRHENVVLCRVFVFNNSFELTSAPIKGISSDPNSLVIFPPEGECEGGSMVAVHLQEVMSHASVKVIESLERQMRSCEEAKAKGTIPTSITLSTFHDDIELTTEGDTATNAGVSSSSARSAATLTWAGRRQGAVKKRLQERLKKWMGDLCLQVCSPIDAIEYYSSSISEARVTGKSISAGDCLWLAGALEGFVTATLMLLRLNLPVEDILAKELRAVQTSALAAGNSDDEVLSLASKVILIVEERALESLSLYARNIIFSALEVECSLRLARTHEQFDTNPDRNMKVLEHVMRAASVPGLNSQQQIECVLEGALICRRMGLKRKYALLLYVAALMSSENENVQLAYALIRNACTQYGVAFLPDQVGFTGGKVTAASTINSEYCMTSSSGLEWTENVFDPILIQDAGASWACMRKSMFGYAAYFARQSNDNSTAVRLVSALLRLMLFTESSNIRDYGSWISVLEQHMVHEPLGRTGSIADDSAQFAPSRLSSFAEFEHTDNVRAAGFNGVSFSAAPIVVAPGDYVPRTASGRPRPGRFSISSLREFEANGSLSSQQRSNSIVGGSVSGASVFSVTPSAPTSSLFHSYSGSSSTAATNAETGSKVAEDDTAKLTDMVYDSAEAIRSGLRRIAAPSLPPKILALVRDGGQNIRNRIKRRQQEIRKVYGMRFRPEKTDEAASQHSTVLTGDENSYIGQGSFREIHQGADYREELLALQRLLENASIPSEQQDEALAMLEDIAKQVDPCCPVNLPVLSESLRPMLLPLDGQRPIRLPVESQTATEIIQRQREKGGREEVVESVGVVNRESFHDGHKKSSALFYDPFAAQRAKDIKSKSVTEVIWSVGTVGLLVLLMSNPLAVPISYDAVSVLLEGPPHIAFESDVTLPPYVTNFEVLLAVKPLQPGILSVRGATVRVNNTVRIINIDLSGKCNNRQSSEFKMPWKYPYKFNDSKKDNAPSTIANSDNSKQSAVASIATNSIFVVPVGLIPKLLPTWSNERLAHLQDSNIVIRGLSGTSPGPALPSTALFCHNMTLLRGETRRESIRLVQDMCSSGNEGLQVPSLALTHMRIVVHQVMKSGKQQSYVLRQFGGVFADRSVGATALNPSQPRACTLLPITWTLPCPSTCLDLCLDFEFRIVPDTQHLVIEVDVLSNKDTDFDAISDNFSDVEDRSYSLFCRRSSVLIRLFEESTHQSIELAALTSKVPGEGEHWPATARFISLQFHNGSDTPCFCGSGPLLLEDGPINGTIASSESLNNFSISVPAKSSATAVFSVEYLTLEKLKQAIDSLRWRLVGPGRLPRRRYGTVCLSRIVDSSGKFVDHVSSEIRSALDSGWQPSLIDVEIAFATRVWDNQFFFKVQTRKTYSVKFSIICHDESISISRPGEMRCSLTFGSTIDEVRTSELKSNVDFCCQGVVCGKLYVDLRALAHPDCIQRYDHDLQLTCLVPGYYAIHVGVSYSTGFVPLRNPIIIIADV